MVDKVIKQLTKRLREAKGNMLLIYRIYQKGVQSQRGDNSRVPEEKPLQR